MNEVKKYNWCLAEDVLTKLAVYTKLTNAKRLQKMTVGDVVEYQKAAKLLDDVTKNPSKYFKDDGSFCADLLGAFNIVCGQGNLYPIYTGVFNTIAMWHKTRVGCPDDPNCLDGILESFSMQLDERIKIVQLNPIMRIFKQMTYNLKYKSK